MRIAHVQPVVVGVVTGGVLAAAASGFSLAPVELTAAVAASTGAVQQCQPLPPPTSSPTATPTPTATPSGSPSPQPSASDPTASTSGTATPTATASKPPTASTDPSPSAHTTTATAKPSTSSTPAPTKTSSASATAAKPSATQTQAKAASAALKATTSPTPTSSPATADPPVSSSPTASATSPTAQPGQVSLCVAVQPAKSSIQRGQTAVWTVTAWAQGGDVPDATIRLMAAPASLKPTFSFGCGSHDGSTSCDLGALDAKSARRQLQAKIAVAASATTVTSVRLTAAARAAGLTTDPQASATISVTAASPAATNSADPSAPSAPAAPGGPDVAPLTAGNLPYLPSASPVLSPGGNAAGLFPALTPSADPPAAKQDPQNTQPVANTSALPQDAPVIGAQLAGLAVLALAFLLAVARLSFRRRPTPAQSGPASAGKPAESAGKPAEPSDPPDEPPAQS